MAPLLTWGQFALLHTTGKYQCKTVFLPLLPRYSSLYTLVLFAVAVSAYPIILLNQVKGSYCHLSRIENVTIPEYDRDWRDPAMFAETNETVLIPRYNTTVGGAITSSPCLSHTHFATTVVPGMFAILLYVPCNT